MQMKDSVQLSLAKSETVCGYEIRRLPLGAYLQAIEALKDSSRVLMDACFLGLDPVEVMGRLRTINAQTLTQMLFRLMKAAPQEAIRLLSVLTGIDDKTLLEDPNIGLDGAAQMLEAFWRLNDMENFIRAAQNVAARIKSLREKTGFSD